MVDPLSPGVGALVASAPHWFPALRSTLWSNGKEQVIERGKGSIKETLDEKKHQRHVELALQNAAERGLCYWHTPQERDYYRSILAVLSEGQSAALRQEAMELFTLHDDPDVTDLTARYNLSRRISALADHQPPTDVDAAPYLKRFFEALLVELYQDPLFRAHISDAIIIRANWHTVKISKQDQLAYISYLGFILHQRAQETEQSQKNRNMRGAGADTAVDVPADFIRTSIKQFLTEQDLLARAERHAEAERFLACVQKGVGLLVARGTDESGEAFYGFVHRTFQEYFAALHIFNLFQQGDAEAIPQFLAQHAHDPHWQEVIVLLLDKVPHTLATSHLRRILQEGTDRSHYANLLQQDLFLVCTCLADGISIEETLAEEILQRVETVIEQTPYPSQRARALEMLVRLQQTQHYAELSQRVLQPYTTTVDLSLQIQVARAIYKSSPAGSDEKRAGARLLIARFQQGDLSLDQQIQVTWALYLCSPSGSDEQREGARLPHMLFQQGGLSLDQQIQLARIIYRSGPVRSDERREGARLLIARFQQGDLSFDQQIQVAEAIYLCSPSQSDERLEATRLLTTRFQQGGLSLDQQIQVAEAISQYSSRGSRERREGTRLLIACLQQGDLSFDQQIQLAQTLYETTPYRSDERREGTRLLIARFHRGDLSFDQQIQLAQAISHATRGGSDDQREGARLLIARFHRGDLSFDQQIQLAQAIYRCSPRGSDEQREGAHLLIARFHQGDLSFDQQVRLAQAISQTSPSGSDEQREGIRLLIARFQQGDLSLDQQVRLAQAIYQASPYGSDEQRERARLLHAFLQQGNLPPDQQMQVAQTLYQYSPDGSDERREHARLLAALLQQGGLSLDQQTHEAQTLYQYSPYRSDEQREGFRMLCQYIQSPDLSYERRLQLATLPCEQWRDNFSERAEAIRLLLTFNSQNAIANILKEKWKSTRFTGERMIGRANTLNLTLYSKFLPDIPAIYALATQEVLPVSARDEMHELLWDMVPLFDRLGTEGREH